MKRLKYLHPFGGRTYPRFIILGAFLAGLMGGIITDIENLFWYALLPPLIVTALMLFFFNIPDDHDRDGIRDASYPIWNPVTPEIMSVIRKEEQSGQLSAAGMIILSLLAAFASFALSRIPPRGSREPIFSTETSLLIALIIGAAAFFTILFLQLRSRIWEQIDNTAMFAEIPIDHFYDVRHSKGQGETEIINYLVYYLPDGKYIMRAPEKSGLADCVTVIKFRRMVRCMVLSGNVF